MKEKKKSFRSIFGPFLDFSEKWALRGLLFRLVRRLDNASPRRAINKKGRQPPT